MSVTPVSADVAPAVPWRGRDLVSLATRLAVGVAVAGVAVFQASGKATVAAQIPWATWAVAGVVVIGVANGLWLLAVRQTVGRRARALFDELAALERPAVSSRLATTDGVHHRALVAARGMTRFHHRSCPLAAGKPVRATSRATHERAGRRPCGVCAPELEEVAV